MPGRRPLRRPLGEANSLNALARRWQVSPNAPPDQFARFPHLDPITVQVLFNRGLCEPKDVDRFLREPADDGDPFQLSGMRAAVTRVQSALETGERIVVYGDFDVDGVTATALLVQTLTALGGDVSPYIPDRVDEGYGLRTAALGRIAEDGASLVLTVDCGVRSVAEVAHANDLGLDVIITDHHSVGPQLPDAVAVVDPKRDDDGYPFEDLAGVGVAYRLAQALLRECPREGGTTGQGGLEEGDLLDLVALGTVADLAPLRGENRVLVRQGLARINRKARLGISSLSEQARVRNGRVDAEAIGYGLGPRLNAAGRLGSADLAYDLLMADSPYDAKRLARELDRLNRERQRLTSESVARSHPEAKEQVAHSPLIFVADADLAPGIIGLVAGRLADEFYRPAIVVERGQDLSRGSARSIDEFHITEALDACRDLLDRHGGHAAAAGFEVQTRNLDGLEARLRELAIDQLAGVDLAPTFTVDAEIEVPQVSETLVEELGEMEPFGYGNPKPLFVSRHVRVLEGRRVGRDQSHLKLTFLEGGASWDGIAFRQGDWADRLPRFIDIVYHVELNEWRGERRLQLNVQDLQPSVDRPGATNGPDGCED